MPRGLPGTLFRIALVCLVVGLVLSWLGITPQNLLSSVSGTLGEIFGLVVSTVSWALPYILLGALIVLPIWGIAVLWRLLSGNRR